MRILIYFGLILLFPTMHAAPADDHPRLTAYSVYASVPDAKVHVIIGKREAIGRPYILIYDDGHRWAPDLESHSSSEWSSDKDLNFYLVTGERISIPGVEAKGELPRIMFPNRAPETLRKVIAGVPDLDLRYLDSHFTHHEATPTETPAQSSPEPVPLENLNNLILLGLPSWPDVFAPAEKILRDADPRKVRFIFEGKSPAKHFVLCTRDEVDAIRKVLSPDAFDWIDVIDFRSWASGNDDLAWLGKLVTNKVAFKTSGPGVGSVPADWSYQNLIVALDDLQHVYDQVEKFIRQETATNLARSGRRTNAAKILRRSRSHGLSWMLRALTDAGRDIFDLLKVKNDPHGAGFIVERADAVGGSGYHLFEGSAPQHADSWFSEWIKQQRWRFAMIDSLPRELGYRSLESMALSDSIGVHHPYLGITSRLRWLHNDELSPELAISGSPTKRLPTLLLGAARDVTKFQKEIVDFVINADKKAQALAEWRPRPFLRISEHGSYPETPIALTGDYVLHAFIAGLNAPPPIDESGPFDFKLELYRERVLEIFASLLDTAPTSIVNASTYASILDSSMAALEITRREFDPGASKHPGLAGAALNVQTLLSQRLAAGLRYIEDLTDPRGNPVACSIMLSSNPWQRWRLSKER